MESVGFGEELREKGRAVLLFSCWPKQASLFPGEQKAWKTNGFNRIDLLGPPLMCVLYASSKTKLEYY